MSKQAGPSLRRLARAQERILERREELPDARRRLLDSLERSPGQRGVGPLVLLVAALALGGLVLLRLRSAPTAEIHRGFDAPRPSSSAALQARTPLVEPEVSAPSPSSPVPVVSAAPPRLSRPRLAPAPATSEEPAPPPTWRQMALRGQHREALSQAEASGFDGLCATLPPGDLLMLADTARFAGRTDCARQALLALRSRFPGGSERALAAFSLGRIAADEQHDHLAAAHWFEATLEEQSGGDLAREALGRLVESLERGGDHPAARRRAQSYLGRFPGGPHARFAHDVLQY